MVVVGDLIGTGASQEQAIVGETPNLAARLQGIAEPNSVVIAKSTRKLVGNLFELEDLGAKDLKGIAGPVRAWAALRTRFGGRPLRGIARERPDRLVGREEELDLLLRRWSKAKNGEGQVVLLSGEAGIGKSRLTAALLERLAARAAHALALFLLAAAHGQRALSDHRPDGTCRRICARRCLASEARQARCAARAELDRQLRMRHSFAEMLSLPNDGRYPALELTPHQRRQKTFEALTFYKSRPYTPKSILMIFEDAHWPDPTSLELFGRIVDRITTLRVLLIVTFRPEFEPPWIGRPYVTALTINRLA